LFTVIFMSLSAAKEAMQAAIIAHIKIPIFLLDPRVCANIFLNAQTALMLVVMMTNLLSKREEQGGADRKKHTRGG